MEQDQNNGRKRFSPEEKFNIVKEQLTTKTSVSEICKKYGVSSSNYYLWLESFLSGALAGFDKKRGPQPSTTKFEEKLQSYESEIQRMHGVIAEITAENVGFKKKFSGFPSNR